LTLADWILCFLYDEPFGLGGADYTMSEPALLLLMVGLRVNCLGRPGNPGVALKEYVSAAIAYHSSRGVVRVMTSTRTINTQNDCGGLVSTVIILHLRGASGSRDQILGCGV